MPAVPSRRRSQNFSKLNSRNTHSLPASPIRRARAGSSSNFDQRVCATSAALAGSTSKPCSPERINSAGAPTRGPTTGLPRAMASRKTMPNPSPRGDGHPIPFSPASQKHNNYHSRRQALRETPSPRSAPSAAMPNSWARDSSRDGHRRRPQSNTRHRARGAKRRATLRASHRVLYNAPMPRCGQP